MTIGENVGKLKTDYDFIVDVQVADEDATKALLEGDAYGAAMAEVIPVTKHEWTARLSHVMHGV